jgi:hypothetical protein
MFEVIDNRSVDGFVHFRRSNRLTVDVLSSDLRHAIRAFPREPSFTPDLQGKWEWVAIVALACVSLTCAGTVYAGQIGAGAASLPADAPIGIDGPAAPVLPETVVTIKDAPRSGPFV